MGEYMEYGEKEKILEIFNEKCRKRLHPSVKIYKPRKVSNGEHPDEHSVVMWCPICETVTIDIEYGHGSRAIGKIVSAREPKIFKISKKMLTILENERIFFKEDED